LNADFPTTEAIVAGASAGAIDALSSILPALRADYPIPLILVIHVPADRESVLAQVLGAKCRLRVKEVEDKEPIVPGSVYVAPPDYHVLVESDRRLSLSSEERVHFSRPSIDVLFESAADVYGRRLLGVLLTGANSDGANGLRTILNAGGSAIVQTPESAYASAMPEAALALCPGVSALSPPEIGNYLEKLAAGVPK
jgi:two-component system, chemotaxis family, protein-glutamate methylesterase/glutaminase